MTSAKDKAIATLALGIHRMSEAGFSPKEIEESVKVTMISLRNDLKPVALCFGNPTVDDCIKYGRCTRNPACDE